MSYEGLIKEKKEDYEKHCIVEATESGCKLDCEIFKTFRDKPIVKSIKTGEEVGGVNESAWYFQLKGDREQLVFDVLGDGNYPSVTGKNANYLKVLPCEKGQFHRLELCDKDGTIFKKTEDGARISISKCNLVGGRYRTEQVCKERLAPIIHYQESRPAELPHQSLAELHGNLSAYTAPII